MRYARYALVAVPRQRLPAMPAGYTVRSLTQDDLDEQVIDAPRRVQQDRFAQGMACLGAFNRKGALVGVIWIGLREAVEDDISVRFIVPNGHCWDTGLWIAPQHRMSRAFTALWAGVAEWMGTRGLVWSLSRIADYNIASGLSHRRLGARVLDHHIVLRIAHWQIAFHARPRVVRADRGEESRHAIAPLAPPPVAKAVEEPARVT